MSDINVSSFSSLDDLTNALKIKYSNNTPHYLSTYRYPSTIIFFDSKKDYYNFLNKIPYEQRHLSNEVDKYNSLSGYKIKKWFKYCIRESKDRPIVALPVTEYIRLCKKEDENLVNKIFQTIVQAESAQLIVPMLDYSNSYSSFFSNFAHQERMADVFTLNSADTDDDSSIEIILDKTGKIPSEDCLLISHVRDWLKLWENGSISLSKKILVQNKTIIEAIEEADITVPKVQKCFIRNELDFLQFTYDIDVDEIKVATNSEVLAYLLDYFSKSGKIKNWTGVVQSVLGINGPTEDSIQKYWEGNLSEQFVVHRWFWLNEAKKLNCSSSFLSEIIQITDDPELLLDNAFIEGLKSEEKSDKFLNERRVFFNKLENPYFSKDQHSFHDIFITYFESSNSNWRKILERTTGLFDFERETIVLASAIFLKEQEGFPPDLYQIVLDVWPVFATYIESSLMSDQENLISAYKKFDTFADCYLSEYVRSKIGFDKPTEMLKEWQNHFLQEWDDIIAARTLNHIRQFSDSNLQDKIYQNGFVFLDAVGYEWSSVLKALFKEKGWEADEGLPVFSNLPSDTTHFVLENPIEKYPEFDKLIHETYVYPKTIFKEIQKLEEIVTKIDQMYKSRHSPLWIISDHGTTAFARKGSPRDYTGVKKDHGGRFGTFSKDIFQDKKDVFVVTDNNKKFAVSLSNDNLGDTSPKGEAHGGGLPEEVLALAMQVYPPKVERSKEYIDVVPEKISFDGFGDEELILKFEGRILENITVCEIKFNNSWKKRLDDKYRKTSNSIRIPLSEAKAMGMVAGMNEITVVINKSISGKCSVELISGSEKTSFDDTFDI